MAPRLVNVANTCSLSFELGLPGRMERYREVVQSLLAVLFIRGSASPETPPMLWICFS